MQELTEYGSHAYLTNYTRDTSRNAIRSHIKSLKLYDLKDNLNDFTFFPPAKSRLIQSGGNQCCAPRIVTDNQSVLNKFSAGIQAFLKRRGCDITYIFLLLTVY